MTDPSLEALLARAFEPDLTLLNGPFAHGHEQQPVQRSSLGLLPLIEGGANDASYRIGDAAGVDALVNMIRAVLCNPVRVETIQGRQYVSAAGMAVFGLEPDGRWSTWLWQCDGAGVVSLSRAGNHSITVANCPCTNQWMHFFIRVYLARSGISDRYPPWAVHEFMSWLNDNLKQRLWCRRLRQRVRAELAKVMPWDRQALTRARSVVLHSYYRHPVRLDAYQQALIHAPAYDIVLSESPALAALVDLFADDIQHRLPDGSVVYSAPGLSVGVDVKLALKLHLQAHGVKPAWWRMLTRLDTASKLRAWFDVCMDPFEDSGRRQPEVALTLLRLAQEASAHGLVDSEWMELTLDVVARRTSHHDKCFEAAALPLMRFMGHLLRLEQGACIEESLRLSEQKQLVLEWAGEQIEAHGVEPLLRLRLETILWRSDPEQLAQWQRLSRMGEFPAVAGTPLHHSAWEIAPLASGRALWMEGRRMRHCVADRADRALGGDSLFVSVRLKGKSIEDERPLATAEISLKGKVRLAEIKGFANGRVDTEIIRFVRLFAASVRGHRTAERRKSSLAPLVDQVDMRTAA